MCTRIKGEGAKGENMGALRADIATVGGDVHLSGLGMTVGQINPAAG
ncbi:Uncharacterised protein [Yersinia enterocolitica]|nr:Uncharacterised protein [Yersinia mollaretii]CNL48138.1 Uncharacterised protein [Yersinia enterocolitica]